VWSRDLTSGQGYSPEGRLYPDLIHYVGYGLRREHAFHAVSILENGCGRRLGAA
jgi:hypothetical protein